MKKILEVSHLEKSYHENKAVNDLSFHVNEGEILGLLGPNGAGKSTTISILSTLLKQDKGSIIIFALPLESNVQKIKANVGIVPQDIAVYEELSAYKNVAFFASLYGVNKKDLDTKVREALAFVGLDDKRNHTPKTFSGGMKRRLNIACAIAHAPKLLILDEPTVGIDPQSRNHILSSLKTLKERGTTIIYTTHYMEEVEAISDRIVIMDKGEKIAEGSIKELLEDYQDTLIYTMYLDRYPESLIKALEALEGIETVQKEEDALQITVSKKHNILDEMLLLFREHNCHITKMETEEGNLEMVFLELTGKRLRD